MTNVTYQQEDPAIHRACYRSVQRIAEHESKAKIRQEEKMLLRGMTWSSYLIVTFVHL